MDFITLLGSVQAFFMLILLFNKKGKSAGDYTLGVWLAFMGIHLFYHYLFATGFTFHHPHLLGIGAAFPMLEASFMFVYVLVMMSESGKFKLSYLLHGIPFLVFTIFFFFDFYFLSAEEKLDYYAQIAVSPNLAVRILSSPNMFLGLFYAIWSLVKLSRHSRNIANNFSYTEQINLNWLKYIIGCYGFVFFVGAVIHLFENIEFLQGPMHIDIIYLAQTIAIFFLGYFGIKQQAIYNTIPIDKQDQPKNTSPEKVTKGKRYLHSGLKQQQAEQYLKSIKDYFSNEKPYLKGKLSLNEVATVIDISNNHLSQVINEQLGMTFFDFVNNYRIEEVKSRLNDPGYAQYTLLGIAYDSGFNSKSSFNNIFKKVTGLTPSQYIKQFSQ